MKRTQLTWGLLLAIFLHGTAQRVADDTYWFYFSDKDQNSYSLTEPGVFLSERSLDRRAHQGLKLDMTDLPVSDIYLDSIRKLDVEIVHVSKWLNGVLIETSDAELAETMVSISFLDTLPWQPDLSDTYTVRPATGDRFDPPAPDPVALDYGYALTQVGQLNIQYLHNRGYDGAGVYVAVLDGGFKNMNGELPAFTELKQEGRLVAARTFVREYDSPFERSSHGTSVASAIAGKWEGMLIGTGPGVSLILATTENALSETRIEEFAWIEAAEWADSLGTDIINTSLGYSLFDDSTTNYTDADLDGETAFISRANSMVAGKGILSVTSAGNAGNKDWFYITPPADAKHILTVGAVDSTGTIVDFSSRGPTYDQRIKPDVVAMGKLTALQGSDGQAYLSNGTSYSSPLIAGAAASLWQAYPEMKASELIRAIRISGNRRQNPDVTYGFGIPDFIASYHAISSVPGNFSEGGILVYPNPFRNTIHIEVPHEGAGNWVVNIFDLQGRKIHSGRHRLPADITLPGSLARGIYMLTVEDGEKRYTARIMK